MAPDGIKRNTKRSKKMKILDGRKEFYQWDSGVRLTSDDFKVGDEVHFDNGTAPEAEPATVYLHEGRAVADVPETMLQSARPIHAFHYVKEDNCGYTLSTAVFVVRARPKPADYDYSGDNNSGEDTRPEITFDIEGRIYLAREGMTWGEWVDSPYNDEGLFSIPDSFNEVYYCGGTFCGTPNWDSVQKGTDVIIDGASYER
jgi:hypothetical protein